MVKLYVIDIFNMEICFREHEEPPSSCPGVCSAIMVVKIQFITLNMQERASNVVTYTLCFAEDIQIYLECWADAIQSLRTPVRQDFHTG